VPPEVFPRPMTGTLLAFVWADNPVSQFFSPRFD
jgi:hypothetical protein